VRGKERGKGESYVSEVGSNRKRGAWTYIIGLRIPRAKGGNIGELEKGEEEGEEGVL